jgi:serine/threonine protein phosphatase PrpC
MNADNDFQIGKEHLICQDYSMARANETEAFAILCDGCSASPDVDIGARLLALAAREIFIIYPEHDYETFGLNSIQRANTIYTSYPNLHPQALDSTLLVASVKDNNLRAYIYGDGVFFHKTATGLYAMHIELTSGAPDYLSYNLDTERIAQYTAASDEKHGLKVVDIQDENGTGKFEYKPFSPVIVQRTVQPGDIVAVCSDGINSFRRSDNSEIPWLELAEEFIGFKSTAGVFVKRRLAAFKRKCEKDGWTHSDDISVAAIIV